MSTPRPAWLRRNLETYVGNAVAVRDYRAQLRGFRAPILWGVYMAVMVLLAVLNYSNIATGREVSVTQAQSELQGFYFTMMAFLGVTVILVAPGLTATAVVSERMRRSLDLVFSSPVEPKYYLVGKIVSSYRYSWMLLVLSLPITATCVVLGGATWQDVVIAYILLSLIGLILTAVSLLISATATKVVSAVIQSYAVAILYFIGSAVFAGAGAMSFRTGGSFEAPFTVCLNPTSVTFVPGSYTVIGGHNVPNWILVLLLALAFTKLCVLTAATSLCPVDGGEVRSLRFHSILYMAIVALIGVLVGQGLGSFAGIFAGGGPVSSTALGDSIAIAFAWSAFLVGLFASNVSCYGTDLGRRFLNDGWCSWKGIWRGTPSGGLPFLALLWAALVLFFWAWTAALGLPAPDEGFAAVAVWALGLFVGLWGLARFTSRFGVTVSTSRLLWGVAVVLVTAVPPVVLSVMTFRLPTDKGLTLWKLYPLFPLLSTPESSTWVAAGVLAALGTVLAILGDVLRRKTPRVPPIVTRHG